jgi:hypothetical protein
MLMQNFELTVHEHTWHPLKSRYCKNDNLDLAIFIFRAELRKVGMAAGYAEEGEDGSWLQHIGMIFQSPDWKIKWG